MTSDIVDTVFEMLNSSTKVLYTTFKAESFVNGSSSLEALERLLESGVKIYHLPKLHAKIVHSDDLVIVGSQNLTSNGQFNLESSFISSDHTHIEKVAENLLRWTDDADEVTVYMINIMKEKILDFIGPFNELRSELELIDENLRCSVQQGTDTKLKEVLDDLNAKFRASRSVNFKKLTHRSDRKYAKAGYVETGIYGEFLVSLITKDNFSLWNIDGEDISLSRLKKYPILDVHSGKLGWARVGKTRLTFISKSGSRMIKTKIYDYEVRLRFSAIWDDKSDCNLNLYIENVDSSESAQIACLLNIDRFDHAKVKKCSEGRLWHNFIDRIKEVLLNPGRVSYEFSLLMEILLKPVNYRKHDDDIQADEFFNETELATRYMFLVKIMGQNVLIADKS